MRTRLLCRLIQILFLSLITLSFAGCSSTGRAGSQQGEALNVFAAASLSNAFDELGDKFTVQYPGVEVVFNYGGSQALAQQIMHGAPADVFASANVAQMEVVLETGRVRPADVQPFALNRLVVAYPADNPGNVTGLEDLSVPGLVLVLAAEEVPAGGYSLQFLQNASQAYLGADYQERVLSNVVSYEENVRSVLSKVALGEADAGLVYQTDVLGDLAEKVDYLPIPDGLNVEAVYPLARILDGPNRPLAEAFIEFTLSSAGQEILAGYGFTIMSPVEDG